MSEELTEDKKFVNIIKRLLIDLLNLTLENAWLFLQSFFETTNTINSEYVYRIFNNFTYYSFRNIIIPATSKLIKLVILIFKEINYLFLKDEHNYLLSMEVSYKNSVNY